VSTWQQENILKMGAGDKTEIAGYSVLLKNVVNAPGSNYDAERGVFEISRGGNPVATLNAERRFYTLQQRETTETGIRSNFISNIYIALGDPDDNGHWTVRMYYHPLAPWLWLGGLMMAAGGFISLSDRRFRVGVPQRASSMQMLAVAK
jgi:cytochrome c-type biogenesis protein CcmF